MSLQPAVVVAHGAWHQPAHYEKLVSRLSAAGFLVSIPHLPTCSNTIPPVANFQDDCNTIRSAVTELADKGHPILVLMHSYGGVVGTNSLKDLSLSARAAQGLAGGVIRLFFMCSFLLPLNAKLSTAFGGELPPVMAEQPEQKTCTMRDPAYIFYEEVADEEERQRYLSLMTWHPADVQKDGGLVKYASYRDIPTSYLICENDRGLLAEIQRGMIAGAEGDIVKHGEGPGAMETGGVFGGKVHVMTCDGGHSPYLSMPEVVVDKVQEAWELSGPVHP